MKLNKLFLETLKSTSNKDMFLKNASKEIGNKSKEVKNVKNKK